MRVHEYTCLRICHLQCFIESSIDFRAWNPHDLFDFDFNSLKKKKIVGMGFGSGF